VPAAASPLASQSRDPRTTPPVFRAAASTLLRPVLDGPPRPGVVLGVTNAAVYIEYGHPDVSVVGLVTADAVRVSNALAIPAGSDEAPFAAVAPETRVTIRLDSLSAPQIGAREADLGGTQGVRWPGAEIVVDIARWWRPPRPRIIDPARAIARRDELRELVDASAAVPSYLVEPIHVLRAAVVTGDVRQAVSGLVGLGPGLTPSGDDVLASTLVTLRALGQPHHALGAAVSAIAPTQTTAISAALLQHAAAGYCIPQLAAVLAALDSGHPLTGPVEALLGVGHRSGGDLARGVLLALRSTPCLS
jgi:hypothetical protein